MGRCGLLRAANLQRGFRMKPKSIIVAVLMLPVMLGINGCLRTHNDVVISQPKPLQVDVNLNGKLTLVIQDARNDMQYIAGPPPAGAATAPAGAAAAPAATPAAAPPPAPAPAPAPGGPAPGGGRERNCAKIIPVSACC